MIRIGVFPYTDCKYDYNTSYKSDGIYCSICGMKTYLSDDGTHRRCPNCDDKPHDNVNIYVDNEIVLNRIIDELVH